MEICPPASQFPVPSSSPAKPSDAEEVASLLLDTEVLLIYASQIELDTALSLLEPRSNHESLRFGYQRPSCRHTTLAGWATAPSRFRRKSSRELEPA